MDLHVFVEEPSAEAAMQLLLPKIVGPGVATKVLNFGCKSKLLRKLPDRLAAYADLIGKGRMIKIMIAVDRDTDDCLILKKSLEEGCRRAGLFTASRRHPSGRFDVVNRIVVEELEAWFLGDLGALCLAFPKLRRIPTKKLANTDNIQGGTWEYLHRYLKQAGIYGRSYPKIEAARMIARHMNVDANRSRSFRAFRDAARLLVSDRHPTS